MKPGHQGQVALPKLMFTQKWEDPAVDEKALQVTQGDTVFIITSGGCNTLGFLRFNPAAIYCVDINPAQTYLMELKQSAFRNLSFEMLYAFFGITKSQHRVEIFELLEKDISPEALKFWRQNKKIIENGLLTNGRYEKPACSGPFHIPVCLQRENFDTIKSNINKIHPVTADIKYWLATQPDNFFDAMSLSNICETMDDKDMIKLFSEVKRTCKNSGRIVIRNWTMPEWDIGD